MVQKSCSPRQKLEGKQKGGGKAKEMKRSRRNGFKATGVEISNAETPSVVEEAGNTTSADDNRAHSNRKSRENECNDSTPTTKSRIGAIQHLCHGGGQKLLCLWRICAHGPVLQEQGAEGRLMDERRLEYGERREGNYKHSNNLKEE